MRVGILDNVYDTPGQQIETDWEGFVELVEDYEVVESKKQGRELLPARLKPDAINKKAASVLDCEVLALDFDDVPTHKVDQIKSALSQQDLRFLTYTSYSHTPGSESWRGRLVMPLSRPVTKEEWPGFWGRIYVTMDKLPDFQGRTINHQFALPRIREGMPEPDIDIYSGGTLLNVDAVLQMQEPSPSQLKPPRRITQFELLDLAETLTRKKTPSVKRAGKNIAACIKGESWSEDGQRDQDLFIMLGQICNQWPDVDEDCLLELLTPGFQVWHRQYEDSPIEDTIEKFHEKWARLQENIEDGEEHAAVVNDIDIRDSFRQLGIDRIDPYTEEEIESFAEDAHTTTSEFRRRWIVQVDTSYYIFLNGSYRPSVSKQSAMTAARRDLSPAVTAGVSMVRFNKQGDAMRKSLEDLTFDYGTSANRVIADMSAQHTYYDQRDNVIVEACSPLRDLEPARSSVVERWLELMFGEDDLEQALLWVSQVTNLASPCRALYLVKAHGTGKTLLGSGLSRLWHQAGPTAAAVVSGQFNDAMLRCPLIFADEILPIEWSRAGTGPLREFVSVSQRNTEQKYKAAGSLRGAIRLIIAANNENLITTSQTEDLTNEDIDAINERVLAIRIQPDAREYLNKLGKERLTKMTHGDEIARHALWLRDNYPVEPHGRFLVGPGKWQVGHGMTVTAGVRGAVCLWLLGWLNDPNRVSDDGRMKDSVLVRDGKIHTMATPLLEKWDAFKTNEPAPGANKLGKALQGIAEGDKKRRITVGGKRRDYYVIDTAKLLVWSETYGDYSEEEIMEKLNAPTSSERNLRGAL